MFRCMYMPINYFFYAALQSRFSNAYTCTYICMYGQMHVIFIGFHKILHILECFSKKIFVLTQLIKVSNFSEHFQAYVVDVELVSYTVV